MILPQVVYEILCSQGCMDGLTDKSKTQCLQYCSNSVAGINSRPVEQKLTVLLAVVRVTVVAIVTAVISDLEFT